MISIAQSTYNSIQELLEELLVTSQRKRLISYLLQASDMIEAYIEDEANPPFDAEEQSEGDEPV